MATYGAGPDAGFGSDSAAFDAGFGDPVIEYMTGTGFGDPQDQTTETVWFIAGMLPIQAYLWVPPLGRVEVGEEGGYLLTIYAPLGFMAGSYRVDLLDSDSVQHPIAEPGCHSGVPGQGRAIVATHGRTELSFGTPPMFPGEYRVKLLAPNGVSMILGGTVVSLPLPPAALVDRMASRLPRIFKTSWRKP